MPNALPRQPNSPPPIPTAATTRTVISLRTERQPDKPDEAFTMSGTLLTSGPGTEPPIRGASIRFRTTTDKWQKEAEQHLNRNGFRTTGNWTTNSHYQEAPVETITHDHAGRSIPTLQLIHAVSGTRLHDRFASTQEIRDLINAGADVNAFDHEGFPLLIDATITQGPEVVRMLVAAGANPDQRDNDTGNQNNTVLHTAIEARAPMTNIEELILNSKDLDARDYYSGTALHLAAALNYVPAVKRLLEAGANLHLEDEDHLTPLMHACKNNHTEVALLLLEHNASPNYDYCGDIDESIDQPPLAYAIRNGNAELVEALMEAGANPTLPTRENTPLWHLAIEHGHIELIPLLFKHQTNDSPAGAQY